MEKKKLIHTVQSQGKCFLNIVYTGLNDNIKIIPGDEFMVTSTKKLEVTEDDESSTIFLNNNTKSGYSETIIIIPRKTELSKVDINLGNGEISLVEISTNLLFVTLTNGCINARKSSVFDSAKFSVTNGNIVIDGRYECIDSNIVNGTFMLNGILSKDSFISGQNGIIKLTLIDSLKNYSFKCETNFGFSQVDKIKSMNTTILNGYGTHMINCKLNNGKILVNPN